LRAAYKIETIGLRMLRHDNIVTAGGAVNDGVKQYFSEVRMFYRTTTSGPWTDAGALTRSGDTYSFNYTGIVPAGTTV
jgi:hypothetical protein